VCDVFCTSLYTSIQVNHKEKVMLTKKIVMEVSADSEEALEAKIQAVLSNPGIKEAKQDFWVNQGSVDYLEDIVRKGYAQDHHALTPIYRTKQRPNSLPVYVGEFGMLLGRAPQRRAIVPPDSFVELTVDGTFAGWLSQIADNSTSPKERRALVQNVRSLVAQCAFEQRCDSEVMVDEQLKNGEWYGVHPEALPAPYEEVRILMDRHVRIARLAYNKTHFQLAHYNGSTKSQYVVMLEHVRGWQPLVCIPAIPAEEAVS
jgi:hypothetical protein